jgi:hypothetical protein
MQPPEIKIFLFDLEPYNYTLAICEEETFSITFASFRSLQALLFCVICRHIICSLDSQRLLAHPVV